MKGLTVFGIDLTSTENKPTACFGLDDKLQIVYLGLLARDSDIIDIINFYCPETIAIDAPLSLPVGLCCLEESCSCQPRAKRKNRQCDQELRKEGISCYPTTKKTFIKPLIYRGIALKNKLYQMGFKVIEVYPYASKVRLFGKPVPRKNTPRGIALLKEELKKLLPALNPHLDIFNHDLCDAAIAAYTAFLYCRNMVAVVGNEEEGLIFIPLEQLSHH